MNDGDKFCYSNHLNLLNLCQIKWNLSQIFFKPFEAHIEWNVIKSLHQNILYLKSTQQRFIRKRKTFNKQKMQIKFFLRMRTFG